MAPFFLPYRGQQACDNRKLDRDDADPAEQDEPQRR